MWKNLVFGKIITSFEKTSQVFVLQTAGTVGHAAAQGLFFYTHIFTLTLTNIVQHYTGSCAFTRRKMGRTTQDVGDNGSMVRVLH